MVRKLLPILLILVTPLAARAVQRSGQPARTVSTRATEAVPHDTSADTARFFPRTHEEVPGARADVAVLSLEPVAQKEKPKSKSEDDADADDEQKDRDEARKEKEEDLYDDGTDALDDGEWEQALGKFREVAQMKGNKADAALYWKAYAENKLNRRSDALATIAALRHDYPQSRWLKDAGALEVEVRQSSGQPMRPENEGDCELKLLAINGLMNSDAEQAVPLLEKVLSGGDKCGKAKEKALFVLAQNGTPQAQTVLAKIARGEGHPELQRKAIQYLGLFGGRQSHQTLADIYASSSDVSVKKQILQSFMISGERDRLLTAAKSEPVPELRRTAIQQLGVMGARNELAQLYQTESSEENKQAILQALFVGGASDKLIELAHTEQNPKLRRTAIRNLGLMGSSRTGEALVSIYESDKDREDRKEVLQALFLENNAHALVEIARKETDPELRKSAVEKLSLMHSKEATDFLMEILNK